MHLVQEEKQNQQAGQNPKSKETKEKNYMDLLDKKLENCIRERVDEPRELYRKKQEFMQNVKHGFKRQFTIDKNPDELDEEEQKAIQKEKAI